jgi:hypothetical protein
MGGEIFLLQVISETTRALDMSLLKDQLGKRKSLSDPRPDYYHYIRNGRIPFALHIEYDEDNAHEDCDDRLDVIANSTDATVDRTYVIRVAGHHREPMKAVCKRYIINKHYTYYKLTAAGGCVLEATVEAVQQRLHWINQGLAPCDSEGRPRKIYI